MLRSSRCAGRRASWTNGKRQVSTVPGEIVIAESAEVDDRARVGGSSRIWGLAQVRENAVVGENCTIGRGAYVDAGVVIGDDCKIQNDALIYAPAVIEDGVFVGPGAVLTNDDIPRAVNTDGSIKRPADWEVVGVTVRRGASIGARAVVLGGVEVGAWALVAAGAVVTRDVAAHALMIGVPARRIAWVGVAGGRLESADGVLVDPDTRARFREVGERLVPE